MIEMRWPGVRARVSLLVDIDPEDLGTGDALASRARVVADDLADEVALVGRHYGEVVACRASVELPTGDDDDAAP